MSPLLRPPRTRRGVSLVETLVVIAIGTVVMSAVATGSKTLLSVDRRVQQRADAAAQVDRLIEQLRADLRAAERVAFQDSRPKLTLSTRSEGTITYELDSEGCVRRRGDDVVRFRLPPGVGFRGEGVMAAAPSIYQVTLQLDESRELPIAAQLGAVRRPPIAGGTP